MLLDTGLSMKGAFAAVTWDRGWTTLSFGFPVVRAEVLQTGWTMVWIIAISVFAFIVVRFEATAAEIIGTKIARETGDNVIVLIIVEEH